MKGHELIVIPSPVEAYTISRVLTMDCIKGEKVTSILPIRRLDIDGSRLAEALFRAYLKQILIDGFYHADPHPGNVFLTDDGRLALIDLGMVARVSEGLQKRLLRLSLSISEGKSEDAVEYAVEIGEKTPVFDESLFARHVKGMITQYQKATIGQVEVGKVILEVLKVAGESGFRFPSELALLAKCLLNLDNIGRTLDPAFDPNAAIRKYAGTLFRQKMLRSLSDAGVYEFAFDSKELVEHLPRRLGKLSEILANNDFKITVDAFSEKYLMMGIQKLANRLSIGMIIAATIIGAALMMRVQTPQFMLFGYPGLAIIFFLIAAVGGLLLATAVLISDERARRKDRGS
jgi:predicted unusual protein kinase regulating ubiquinone biosynthesis (AarF/ABC1/UbiB family)